MRLRTVLPATEAGDRSEPPRFTRVGGQREVDPAIAVRGIERPDRRGGSMTVVPSIDLQLPGSVARERLVAGVGDRRELVGSALSRPRSLGAGTACVLPLRLGGKHHAELAADPSHERERPQVFIDQRRQPIDGGGTWYPRETCAANSGAACRLE